MGSNPPKEHKMSTNSPLKAVILKLSSLSLPRNHSSLDQIIQHPASSLRLPKSTASLTAIMKGLAAISLLILASTSLASPLGKDIKGVTEKREAQAAPVALAVALNALGVDVDLNEVRL